MQHADSKTYAADIKKSGNTRFKAHLLALMWKSYLQRTRRWRTFLMEIMFAMLMFVVAIFTARPVFLTPLRDEAEAPRAADEILRSFDTRTYVGYTPDAQPYNDIMTRAAQLLNINDIIKENSEAELNNRAYLNHSQRNRLKFPVIWINWVPKNNKWAFSIRSTEQARHRDDILDSHEDLPSKYLRSGFLAIQLAVSQAILEHNVANPQVDIRLVSMPVSPLMQEEKVRSVIAWILLCFSLALIPPVLETEALVVNETTNGFKRALRLRHVDFSCMYISWICYAYLTVLPVCFMAAIFLIFIFRWIPLLLAFFFVLSYISIMIMLSLIMAMFHSKALVSCIWSTLFSLMQTFMAELLVHHKYDYKKGLLSFLLHLVVPPLGLVNGFNQFAMLQTGRGASTHESSAPISTTIISWTFMSVGLFALLMLLQRTIGNQRAIGGQVSWKSIIFKKAEDPNVLRPVETPTGSERAKLQEVDELVAKAISFRGVSKSIMGHRVLQEVTMDIYRGEYSMLYAERVQDKLLSTLDDLLTGLTYPDHGTIDILGEELTHGRNYLTVPHMMGYCHKSITLIDDLSVEEHLTLFIQISVWNESHQYVFEYRQIRLRRLLRECDLESVRNHRVYDIAVYYRAQLCWAIALLLEPRVVVMPNFTDVPGYVSVIVDKIMQYRKYLTIVQTCISSIRLEYADRVFLFDHKLLIFGGTPAYMFFKYGRDYRLRLTLEVNQAQDHMEELLKMISQAGGRIRAHYGMLLIIRLPVSPTATVAELVRELTVHAVKYGIISMNISLPDSEEVCIRAITEARVASHQHSEATQKSKDALTRIAEPVRWIRKSHNLKTEIKYIGRKFLNFHVYFKFYFILTVLACVVAGILMGQSLSVLLADMKSEFGSSKRVVSGDLLTIEALEQKTTFMIRSDSSPESLSVAHAYVLSDSTAKSDFTKQISYTALGSNESLVDYLMVRAIHSPQEYVYMYAYGMDISNVQGTLVIQVLYSPLHVDQAASARSLARVYTALLRHYTGVLDTSILVTDQPLALDFTPFMKDAAIPPLLIQFLLIITVSHITLLPSKEHGLIRHNQANALYFSPLRYWATLFLWDLVLFCLLVLIMTVVMISIMLLILPWFRFHLSDLVVVPIVLMLYGLSSIPQAYLFSLSENIALNSMIFIIVNLIFGETAVTARLFYGRVLDYLIIVMNFSPQFNMAFAFVKIKKIFIYNSECTIFKMKNLCEERQLHKCCSKCGILQDCFSRKSYFQFNEGVFPEGLALILTTCLFSCLLLLWEYKIIRMIITYVMSKWVFPGKLEHIEDTPGSQEETRRVQAKAREIGNSRYINTPDPFGECLLVNNLSNKSMGKYSLVNINLGLDKGEALAVSGLKRHGRVKLCELLAGYKLPSEGEVTIMAKWRLTETPHLYAKQVALCCERPPLPEWMTVRDALLLIAVLRGVPEDHIDVEVRNHIDALELSEKEDTVVSCLLPIERRRFHLAATVVGAPPLLVLDECTAFQKFSVRRAIYYILHNLRKRGHSILMSSSRVESHLPMTSRLAILLNGHIYDVASVDRLIETYSSRGYTVVLYLKTEVNVGVLFSKYFTRFHVNDINEVLVNVQVLDDIGWQDVFERTERLVSHHRLLVYSYIVAAIPIDYIYNTIILYEGWNVLSTQPFPSCCRKLCIRHQPKKIPKLSALVKLRYYKQTYDILKLRELPWSVIFHNVV